jgi:predicted Fe-Mo cluster-binding NifX family protein
MPFKIAVASTDGKTVNRHFGAAPQFLILDVDDDAIVFVELRKNEPPCSQGEHSDDLLLSSVLRLSDCRAVLVSRAGPGAASFLSRHNIDVIECGGFITDIILNLRAAGYFSAC